LTPTADSTLQRFLRRDAIIISAALVGFTALAWIYVIRLAAEMDMGGMDMTGIRMVSDGFRMVMASAHKPWTNADLFLMFAMWAVMMIGMMTPSMAPVVLLYARVRRQAISQGEPFAATGWFAGGYLLTWTLFSLLATIAQWALERAALMTPIMTTASATLSATLFVAAGVYQWSPLKRMCLAHCQSPLTFLQRNGGFEREATRSLTLGVRHGVYCVGCCWALMALLFVGGVMNVVWIAGISALVLLEKAVPAGRALGRMAGIGFVAAGVWALLVRLR
jgi:predicted metal-binding membrane protein